MGTKCPSHWVQLETWSEWSIPFGLEVDHFALPSYFMPHKVDCWMTTTSEELGKMTSIQFSQYYCYRWSLHLTSSLFHFMHLMRCWWSCARNLWISAHIFKVFVVDWSLLFLKNIFWFIISKSKSWTEYCSNKCHNVMFVYLNIKKKWHCCFIVRKVPSKLCNKHICLVPVNGQIRFLSDKPLLHNFQIFRGLLKRFVCCMFVMLEACNRTASRV